MNLNFLNSNLKRDIHKDLHICIGNSNDLECWQLKRKCVKKFTAKKYSENPKKFFQISDTIFTFHFPPWKFCTSTSVITISEGSNRYPGNFFRNEFRYCSRQGRQTLIESLSPRPLSPFSYFPMLSAWQGIILLLYY